MERMESDATQIDSSGYDTLMYQRQAKAEASSVVRQSCSPKLGTWARPVGDVIEVLEWVWRITPMLCLNTKGEFQWYLNDVSYRRQWAD
jgi:hypothetical protein